MDFFQGSTLKLISFRSGNQNTEEEQTPASDPNIQPAPNMMPSPPPFPPIRVLISLSSTDSNVDVPAYAAERVRVLEETQRLATLSSADRIAENSGKIGESEGKVEKEIMENHGTTDVLPVTSAQTEPVPSLVRTSTPTPGTTDFATEKNLTELESGLGIATSSRTTLPELLPAVNPANETSAVSFLQPETDDTSSLCDAPNLPQGKLKYDSSMMEQKQRNPGTGQVDSVAQSYTASSQ